MPVLVMLAVLVTAVVLAARQGRPGGNPMGGWYGLRNGYRGRFGMYLPPLLEELGLAELTHDPRNNRMRAI